MLARLQYPLPLAVNRIITEKSPNDGQDSTPFLVKVYTATAWSFGASAKNLLVATIHKQKQMLRFAPHDSVSGCLPLLVYTYQETTL